MKRILILSLSILLFFACKNNTSNNDISADSVYHLPSQWENQTGQKMKMADLKGKVVVMVMIYSTCKTACPILTSEMGEIASRLADVSPKDIRFVMVSIDPQTDTPERMTAYLKKNNFSGEQWLFLRSSEDETRELANVLSVKYKEISPVDFSHSNIISVFSKNGTLAFQKEGLGIDVEGTVSEVRKQLQ